MGAHNGSPEVPTNSELADQLDYIKSLIERRLIDDKVRSKAFDELYAQLEFARRGLTEQVVLPLVREVLLVCDRLERAASEHEVLPSVLDELLEVFRRRGLAEVGYESGFDPARHEIVTVEETNHPEEHRVIRAVHTRGYMLGDTLVRPARVAVAQHSSAAPVASERPDLPPEDRPEGDSPAPAHDGRLAGP